MSDSRQLSAYENYFQVKQRGKQILQEGRDLAKGLRTAFLLVSIMGAAPMELFLRHRFGERYLTVTSFLISLVLASTVPYFISDGLADNVSADLYLLWTFANGVFLLAVLGAGVFHLLMTAARARRGVRWHSMSDGLPLPFWRRIGLQDPVVRLFVEPGLCLFIAGLLLAFATPLAIYIGMSAFILMLNELLRRREQRNELLKMIDGQIEAEEQVNAMRGAPAVETKGFAVRGMQPRTVAERRTLEEMIGGLDPEIRGMMSPHQANASAVHPLPGCDI